MISSPRLSSAFAVSMVAATAFAGSIQVQAQSVSRITASAAAGSQTPLANGPSSPLTVPRVNVPTMPRLEYTRYPWKTDIVATVFWVGETPTENNPTPNTKSSWDPAWQKNFGGFDDPDPAKRTAAYCPVNFTPNLNPFYIALPYNDCIDTSTHKPEAARVIPWFKKNFVRPGKTVLRGTWVAILYGNRVCYAQWEDCGPFVTDDYDYVFGTARPKNTQNKGAGIDISPAVRDYLGMSSSSKCAWRFVDVTEVPVGPWRSLGTNNHFVKAQKQQEQQENHAIASRLEELKRMRDEYFKQNGNNEYRVR